MIEVAVSVLLCAIAVVVGLFMLPFKATRRIGKWAAAVGALGIVVGFAIALVQDKRAQDSGYLNETDRREAQSRGYRDAAAWSPVRAEIRKKIADEKAASDAAAARQAAEAALTKSRQEAAAAREAAEIALAKSQKEAAAAAAQKAAAMRTPAGALPLVTLVSFYGSMSDFGKMTATFTVSNRNEFDVKDIEVRCELRAPSGTMIDSNTRTIYEIFRAGSVRLIRDFNMGFVHSQTKSYACGVTKVTPLP